ncbi:MAG: hypothetical protein QW594_03835, partial [Candidatus Woesearchaeota archaeon]
MDNHALMRRAAEYLLLSTESTKRSFVESYYALPEATLQDFVKACYSLSDVLVLDVGSFFGELAGLWIAKNNPSAQVHVFNPVVHVLSDDRVLQVSKKFVHHDNTQYGSHTQALFSSFSLSSQQQANPYLLSFPPYLFNDYHPQEIFKFTHQQTPNPAHLEESVNALYKANGLENIFFHWDGVYYHHLASYAQQGKLTVIFCDRIPPLKPNMPAVVARVAAEFANVDAVIIPFLNADIEAWYDDQVIAVINQQRSALNVPFQDIVPIEYNTQTCAFTAMNQYYAAKISALAEGKVYRES